MERRKFIKGSAAALTLPFWLQSCDFNSGIQFPVHLRSDHSTGHLLMNSRKWEKVRMESVQTVIVGGGIAGASAAAGLADNDFKLFELSDRLGGTSGAQRHGEVPVSQGAHYDLAYPEYYGEEVLRLFEKLNIIRYEPWKKSWSFHDTQHIVPFTRRQQCFDRGVRRKEVIPEGASKDRFYDLLSQYSGKMPLPTRLITEEFRYLNNLTFDEFLSENIDFGANLKRQVDYHMLDDWGGTTDQVSALAGIHYFMCRPYLTQSVDLFSPTEGNHYFLRKIASSVPEENIHTSHLISKIDKKQNGFEVEVVDVDGGRIKVIDTDRVIYAGQKHALKYIYPSEADLFQQVQAPWMVLNFVCKYTPGKYGYWQNEFLGENPSFLGFIDSSVQDRDSQAGLRIITAYYCLKPEDRNYLTTIESHKEEIAEETLTYIKEMLNEQLEVEACYINVMGHAMSIPVPGFLFNDANDKETDLIYAGVDNGRLPLLYEAVDSGLLASQA